MKTRIALVLLIFVIVGLSLDSGRLLGQEPEALFKQGMMAEKSGDFDTAIADYSQILKTVSTSDKVYYRRATAYSSKSDYGNAIADLDHAIQINPKNAGAYNDLAWLLATCPQDNLRNGKKAVDYANQACQEWR